MPSDERIAFVVSGENQIIEDDSVRNGLVDNGFERMKRFGCERPTARVRADALRPKEASRNAQEITLCPVGDGAKL